MMRAAHLSLLLSALARVHSRSNDTALFKFAVLSDTHVWVPSAARDEYQRGSDGESEWDGLLVSDSDSLLRQVLITLAEFAASGSFAVHAGDAVCGGASFNQTAEDYERSLEAIAAEQRAVLGTWPVFYASGNHDVDPTEGGLAKWVRLLGGSGMGDSMAGASVRSAWGPLHLCHLCTSAYLHPDALF